MTHQIRAMALAVLITLTPLAPVWAMSGPGNGGGGDPVAAEFTFVMSKVGNYLEQHSDVLPELDRTKMAGLITVFRKSLDSKSKIEVVESRPLDPNGTGKAAVFSVSPLLIRVHRQTWQQSPSRDQVTLAGMEIMGIMSLRKERYAKALSNLGDNADIILSSSRQDEMLRDFVRIASDTSTEVAKKINGTRKTIDESPSACGAGTVPSVPNALKMSDVQIITKTSNVYLGVYTGDETHASWDAGYEKWDFLVSVPVRECAYGGHIALTDSLTFDCRFEGKVRDASVLHDVEIHCKSLNKVNPNGQ